MVTYTKLRGISPHARGWTRYITLCLFLLLTTFISTTSFSQVDFRQSANNDAGYGLGNIHWLNSILQQSNSKYVEGMSSLQRVILLNVEPKAPGDNSHSLTFSFQTIKASAGSHAYDFLTSWAQAKAAANRIGQVSFEPDQVLFNNLNECGAEPGSDPTGYLTACQDVHDGTSYFVDVEVVDNDMGSTLGDQILPKIQGYESEFGNRTIRIRGNAPITAYDLDFTGYTGGDMDANYTVSWTSASTTIVIEFATHLAVGLDPLFAGIGYGQGKGAGGISGGPYHVNLWKLDGASLGSQDNQIKAADVLIPPSCIIPTQTPVCEGTIATITAAVQNPGTSPTYTWSFVGSPLGATFVGGTNAPITTTTPSVQVNTGTTPGSVTVRLTVSNQGLTTTCETALGILAEVSMTPLTSITSICPGEDATFTTTVSGDGADGSDVRWYKGTSTTPLVNGGKYTISYSGQVATLVINDVVEADEATYYARIGGTSDLCGTDEESATLTVNENVALVDLAPQTKCPGEDATFTTTVSGTGANGSHVRWYKGTSTTPLVSGGKYTISHSGQTATLVVNDVVEADEAIYYARIGGTTGLCGTDETSAQLTVNVDATLTDLAPQTKCPGEDATFFTDAAGTNADGGDVRWYKGTSTTPLTSGGKYTITASGARSTLVVNDVVEADEATYYARIGGTTGLCGSDEVSALLTVNVNATLTDLAPQTLCPGEDATFFSDATGTGADGADIRWYKGSSTTPLTSGGKYTITVSGARSTLVVNDVVEADEAIYWARIGSAEGLCGFDEASAQLTVNVDATLTDLAPQTLCPGQDATFFTDAAGTNAAGADVRWYKGSSTTPLASGGKYTITVSGQRSTLVVNDVVEADEATYYARIGGTTGLCGSDEVSAALVVNVDATLTDLAPQTLCPGEAAVFTTTAAGTGADGGDIRWYKGTSTTPIADDNVNYDIVVTNGTSTLTIHNVDEADEATYYARIGGSGLCGSDEVSAGLVVNVDATLTDLAPQTKCPGEDATFYTDAAGTNADGADVRWYKGTSTTPLVSGGKYTITASGARSTLVVNDVVEADEATYYARIGGTTGLCGSDEVSALLTVNPTPDCSITGLTTVCAASSNVYQGPAGMDSYAWSFVGSANGATFLNGITNTQSVTVIAGSGNYTLKLVVTDLGCPNECTQLVTVNPCAQTICTYTQGAYGNEGGQSCTSEGQLSTYNTIHFALGNWPGAQLVIGSTARSLTIRQSSSADINAVMTYLPGGGGTATLLWNDGNRFIGDDNAIPGSMLKNGRFNNTLLSQTLALGLNIGLNKSATEDRLGAFELRTDKMLVTATPAAGCNPASSEFKCPYSAYTLTSGNVIAFLHSKVWNGSGFADDNSADKKATVMELFQLASYALGSTPGTTSVYGLPFGSIASLADQLNNIFDECQVSVGYMSAPEYSTFNTACMTTLMTTTTPTGIASEVPTDLQVAAYPNPYNNTVSFNFTAPVAGRASLEVYDLVGRRLAVIFEGQVDAGMQKAVNYNVPSAQRVPMIYRLSVGGKTSFGKLLPGNTD